MFQKYIYVNLRNDCHWTSSWVLTNERGGAEKNGGKKSWISLYPNIFSVNLSLTLTKNPISFCTVVEVIYLDFHYMKEKSNTVKKCVI